MAGKVRGIAGGGWREACGRGEAGVGWRMVYGGRCEAGGGW